MNTRSRALLVAAVCAATGLLAACAAQPQVTTYTHATKTKAEYQVDLYACNQDAALYAQGGVAVDPLGTATLALVRRGDHGKRFYQCMTQAKGWRADAQTQRGIKARYGGTVP